MSAAADEDGDDELSETELARWMKKRLGELPHLRVFITTGVKDALAAGVHSKVNLRKASAKRKLGSERAPSREPADISVHPAKMPEKLEPSLASNSPSAAASRGSTS